MYSVYWQNRGLVHVKILIWLRERILLTDINKVIFLELPYPYRDILLFQIITEIWFMDPMEVWHVNAVFIVNDKCTNEYICTILQETQSDRDGYSLYKWRKPGYVEFSLPHWKCEQIIILILKCSIIISFLLKHFYFSNLYTCINIKIKDNKMSKLYFIATNKRYSKFVI